MRATEQVGGRWWPALDGVRGLAVLAVLGFHAGLERFVGGYLGVDVFFTLSGFLITTLLVGEFRRTGRIDLRSFWRRRARRILPALVLVVATTGLLWVVVGTATQRADLTGDVVAAFGFASNWHEIAGHTGYLAGSAAPSPLLQTWSLAIEEQWYLVWPLAGLGLCALARRLRGGWSVASALCVAGALASSALMAWLVVGQGTGRVYYGTDTRAASLLLGAALAFAVCRLEAQSAGWWTRRVASITLTALAAIGLVGLGVAVATVDHEAPGLYRGGFLLVGLATVTVLAACVHPSGNPVARLLSVAPLRWVGTISYGLYLWHWPVFLFLTPDRTGLAGAPLLVVRLIVSIGLAWACWNLVEQPIRLGRVRPRVWFPASSGVVAVAVAIVVLVQTSQPAFRLPEASALRKGRSVSTATGRAPRPRLFFAGDSIALTLGAGVAWWADHSGRAVVTGDPLLGCGLLDDVKRRREGNPDDPPDYCATWQEQWRDEVVRQSPDAALLVLSVWDLQDHAIDGKDWVAPGDASFDRAYMTRLDAAVNALSSSGAPVGLVTLPVLKDEAAHASGTTGSIPEEQPRVIGHVNDLLRRYASTHRGTFVVDLARQVKGVRRHPSEYRGVQLFGDGSHFTSEAGVMLSPWIVDQVTRVLASRSGS